MNGTGLNGRRGLGVVEEVREVVVRHLFRNLFFIVRFVGAFSHALIMFFVVALLVDVVEGEKDRGSILLIDIGLIRSGEGRHLSLVTVVLKIRSKIV